MKFEGNFDPTVFVFIPTFAFYVGTGFSIQFCWAFWLGELTLYEREL